MADFCLDCSISWDAPEGYSDFKWVHQSDTPDQIVLCEGCGWIMVDADGRRTVTVQPIAEKKEYYNA